MERSGILCFFYENRKHIIHLVVHYFYANHLYRTKKQGWLQRQYLRKI